MNKHYEVYYFSPENPTHLEQWLEGILLTTGLRLLDSSGDYWIFEQTNLFDTSAKAGGFAVDAMESYGEFYDKAIVALGFSSASLPSQATDDMMLERISELFSVVKELADALNYVYNKLPSHWRELPFSYHELKLKVKEIMK